MSVNDAYLAVDAPAHPRSRRTGHGRSPPVAWVWRRNWRFLHAYCRSGP